MKSMSQTKATIAGIKRSMFLPNLPDLNITGINFSDPQVGEFINILVNITNQGNDTAGNRAHRLSIDGTEINLTLAETLQPNMTRSWRPLNDTYTWPPFYHIVSACVDSNNEVNESDESNNCWNKKIYVPPKLPDLNITGINFSDPQVGEFINILVNITNQGNDTAGNRADRLSIDGTEINLTLAETLQPNMTRSWRPLNDTYTWPPFYHIVSACVDSNNEVNESDESNNCWNKKIYVPPKLPDLNITGINFSDPQVGEFINILVNITNQGNDTAGNCADRLSIDGTEINLTLAEPLQPQENLSWRPLNSTYTWTPGDHIVSACTDSNNEVNESDESNNCWDTIIHPIERPDLNITDIKLSKLLEGAHLDISIDVTNQGKGTADNHTDVLRIDGEIINSTVMKSLKLGERHQWRPLNNTYTWTPGDHTLSACADWNHEVNEENENNNCRNETICISQRNFIIRITDRSGTELVDYPVLVDLIGRNYPDRLHDNSELLFSDQEGNSLDYWVEEFDPAFELARVWVKVPFVPGRGSSDIILNISSPSQPTRSNGPSIFEFFDDFNDGSLDMSIWTNRNGNNTSVREEEGSMILHADSHARSSASLVSKVKYETARAVRFRANLTRYQEYERRGMGFLGEDVSQNRNEMRNSVYWRWEDQLLLAHHCYKTAEGATCWITRLGEDIEPGYKVWEIRWLEPKIYYYVDDKSPDPHSAQKPIESIPVAFSLNLSMAGMPSEISVDWVLVRPCVDPEPYVEIIKS